MDICDHIVIGAGSGGCAAAGRLARDPARRVVVLEAGASGRKLGVIMPLAFPSLFHTAADYDFRTEPEPGCVRRRLYEPRARMIGGCSSMNGMVWVRGCAGDYDGWDLDGWSWKEVEPYFRRMERQHPETSGGPNRIGPVRSPDPLSLRFVDSAATAAAPRRDDISGPDLHGTAPALVNIWRGRRWSAARAYLDPARRRGDLTVLTGALAHRLVVEDGRAIGVEYERDGRLHLLRARSDIVLAAGAFGTPHLLQLSGIGDAALLRELAVPCLLDNPHVGAHLAEHPTAFVNYELKPPATGFADANRIRHLLRWLVRHDGMLASNGFEALAHVKTRADLPDPDLQIGFGAAYFWDAGAGTHPRPAVTLAHSYWTPRSEGWVTARSADAHEKPAVQLNLLTDREDVAGLIRAVRVGRAVAAAPPLADVLSHEINPGPRVRTDAELEAWLRRTCGHSFHPSCTARMAPEGDGVLDPRLRVRGINGLRVADASALPAIPHANTNAITILIGERCADFIREDTAH